MPYVKRDKNNNVISISLQPLDDDSSEVLSINDPDVIDFLAEADKEEEALRLLNEYDIAIPRILEDLIDILIRNKVIHFGQFPAEARDKMSAREYLRELLRVSHREMAQEETEQDNTQH